MQEIEKIRKASVGKETREPIASILEKTYKNMCNKEYTNQEVIDARADYSTLNNRLNNIESKISNLKLLKTNHKNSIEKALNELAKKVNIIVESKWKTLASMPTARSSMSSVVIGNKIYCIGGYVSDIVESYETSKDCWNVETTLQNKRTGATSQFINDRIYTFGGWSDFGYAPIKIVECYDIETNTLTTKANMPYGTAYATSHTVNELVYVISGYIDNTNRTNSIQIYNTITDFWSIKAIGSVRRENFKSVLIDNNIYIFGGAISGNEVTSSVECYDIETNALTTKANMPIAKQDFGCAKIGDYIYIIGGRNSEIISNSIERYNYKEDIWETFEMTMTEARAGFVCEVVNNKIYCIGGENKDGLVVTNEVLIVR